MPVRKIAVKGYLDSNTDSLARVIVLLCGDLEVGITKATESRATTNVNTVIMFDREHSEKEKKSDAAGAVHRISAAANQTTSSSVSQSDRRLSLSKERQTHTGLTGRDLA